MARSLVAVFCLVALPRVLAGQADTARADTSALGPRATFSFPPLVLREPEALRAPWLGAPRAPAGLRALVWDSTVAAILDSARVQRAAALRNLTLYGQAIQDQPPESTETRGLRRGV